MKFMCASFFFSHPETWHIVLCILSFCFLLSRFIATWGLWVWFAHRAISYSEDEEENEIQNLTKQDDPQVLVIIVAILLLTVYFLYNEGLQLIGSIYEAYEIKEEDDKSGVVPVRYWTFWVDIMSFFQIGQFPYKNQLILISVLF